MAPIRYAQLLLVAWAWICSVTGQPIERISLFMFLHYLNQEKLLILSDENSECLNKKKNRFGNTVYFILACNEKFWISHDRNLIPYLSSIELQVTGKVNHSTG